MQSKNKRIEIIQAKARQAEEEIKPFTVKRPVFNIKTHRMEVKELIIKSGKEGNSFNRIGLIVFFTVLELLIFAVLYVWLLQAFLWVFFLTYGIGIIFACRAAVGTKNADSKIAWILFLLIFAPIAAIVYLLAGEITASPIKSRKLKRINEKTKLLESGEIPNDLSARVKQDCAYIQNTSDYVPYQGGASEYFPTGRIF